MYVAVAGYIMDACVCTTVGPCEYLFFVAAAAGVRFWPARIKSAVFHSAIVQNGLNDYYYLYARERDKHFDLIQTTKLSKHQININKA